MCIGVHFVSGVPSNSKRDWSLLQHFAYSTLLIEDGEAEEVSLTLSQPPELQESAALSSMSTLRKFCSVQKNVYLWLEYHKEKPFDLWHNMISS